MYAAYFCDVADWCNTCKIFTEKYAAAAAILARAGYDGVLARVLAEEQSVDQVYSERIEVQDSLFLCLKVCAKVAAREFHINLAATI
eukprot:SAG31_NODE_1_length_62978_cov_30.836130_7_plen_87_part_00